jgi:hypothetical protein
VAPDERIELQNVEPVDELVRWDFLHQEGMLEDNPASLEVNEL